MVRRSALASAVALVLTTAVILPVPAPAAGPEGRSDAPAGQITFAITVTLAPTWFDPAETPGVITPFLTLYALHDALVKPMPGNAWAPGLAESWTASKDGLTYEFALRKGVRFHNGDPLTAEDVKFSFDRYRGGGATTLKARVAAVEIVDAQRIRFRMKQPWPDFMTFYATPATSAAWIVPKKYMERVGEDAFKKAPVGAGPYRFVSFNPGVELVVEAYEGYWRKTPAVKRLVFRSVPDEATRMVTVKRGETDIAYGLRGPDAEEVRRTPGLTLKVVLPTVSQWLVFTQQWDPKSPWADRRVRLAANLAIDRKAFSDAEYLGYGRPAPSIIPRDFEFYWAPPPYPYDPARAKRLLDEAGYPKGFDAVEVDRRRVRARGRERHQRASGHRHPRAVAPARARGLLQGGPGEAVQAPGPRRQRSRRQRRDADRGVRDLGRHSLLRRLSGHRRALPRSGGRDGHEATRGAAPQDPAAHVRARDVRADRGAGRADWRRPPAGGGAFHHGAPVHLALRGSQVEGSIPVRLG
jgi:ABC-type transport system substrate-binding protein